MFEGKVDTLEDPQLRVIAAELKADAAAARMTYIINPALERGGGTLESRPNLKTRGNVAVGKVTIPGGPQLRETATSKAEPLNVPTDDERVLPARPVPEQKTAEGQPPVHNHEHSEYKLLNAFARALSAYCETNGISPAEIEGELNMYTEREMCGGCRLTSADEQQSFAAMFPKLKVNVFFDIDYRQ